MSTESAALQVARETTGQLLLLEPGRPAANRAAAGTFTVMGRPHLDDGLLAAARSAQALATSDDAALGAVVALLHEQRPSWDWVGIYLLAGHTLVLGPYVGAVTEHIRIPVGVGVCGTAVAIGRNQIVDDVRALDNYLACSVGTRSEIVVLVRHEGAVVGQFDVDSDEPGAFGPADEALLERLATLVAPRCATLASALSENLRELPG